MVIAPLDYGNPTGKTIEIGFVQFPQIGFGKNPTLQLVGGGPGSSITSELRNMGSGVILPIRLALYDRSMLFIEPRGLALSTNLRCAAFRDKVVSLHDHRQNQLCADQIGPDLDHFTTENSARDFDRVRQALGIADIDLYGFSYGTNLSSTYASRFPQHIRTLGLDGAYPTKTFDLFLPTYYTAMRRQFQQFCERSGQCKVDEVLQALSWATADLRKAPRPLDAKLTGSSLMVRFDPTALAALGTDILRRSESINSSDEMWRMPFISALLRTYRQKDWTYLEAHALESALELAKGSAPGLEGEQQELTMAILCRENTVPWKRTSSIDQRRVEYRAAAAAYDQSNPNKFAPFTAEEWGMAAFLLQYDRLIACPVQKTALPSMSDLKFGWPASLPVLVVNGDYDIQTPNEDAQLAAAQFQKAQFARLKHHGHSILPESFCAVGLLREFLNNKRVADPMKCYDADATGASLEKGKPQG